MIANNTQATITGSLYNDFTIGEIVTVKGYDEKHSLYTVTNGILTQTVIEQEIAELKEVEAPAKKATKKDTELTTEVAPVV
jgi:hypothetical protein